MPTAVVDVLSDGPAVDEDVEVAEDLPDRKDGLRLGDLVRPEHARHLEGRAAAGEDVTRDQLESVRVKSHALLDQLAVVVAGRPVAGITRIELHRLGLAEVSE